MKKRSEHVSFNINTTEEFLSQAGLTIDEIRADVEYLAKLFGTKYLGIFPVDIKTSEIQFIRHCVRIIKAVSKCDGFKTHLSQYNLKELKSHLFSAKVAKYLMDRSFKATLEPDMGRKDGPHPDIKIEKQDELIFVECKTSDISNFYGRTHKKMIADIVYEKLNTCDQIDLFFGGKANVKKIENLFEDQNFIRKIHSLYQRGKDGENAKITVDDDLEINIIQKPAITGAEEDFLEAELRGYLEDMTSGVRSIGFAFMKGGRSVGVYDVVDYENKWKDKREKSQKQLVSGCANIVFIDGTDVVGAPSLHQDYFDNVWLTEDLPDCNGVVVFHQNQKFGSNELEEKVDIYENSHSRRLLNINNLKTN